MTIRLKENTNILEKSSQNNHHAQKCKYRYIKAQFESPKHQQQTTFVTLKYIFHVLKLLI
jgi:hypothetical protein